MRADVPFDELADEAVERTACRRQSLKDLGTARFPLEGSLHRFEVETGRLRLVLPVEITR